MNAYPLRLPTPFRPLAVLLAGLALAATAALPARAAEPLQEREVRAFVASAADAARARDVGRIAAAIADDCRMQLRTRFGGREHVTDIDKAEYVAMLTDGFIALEDLERYDYQVSGVDVQLDGPTAANVRAQVTETLVYAGRSVTTVTDEQSRIERRGGRLVVVSVTATTSAPQQTAAR